MSVASSNGAPEPAPTYEADLGVVVVFDRSGSMTGSKIEWAKAAAKAALGAIEDDDLFEITFSDVDPVVFVSMRRPTDRAKIEKAISSITPYTQAEMLPSLRAASASLDGFSVRRKHILVLTDGSNPSKGLYSCLVDLRKHGDTVTFILLGNDPMAGYTELSGLKGVVVRSFVEPSPDALAAFVVADVKHARAAK